MSESWRSLSWLRVSGVGAGPVTLRPLMLVVGVSEMSVVECLTGQMHRCSGVMCTSSVGMGVCMACGWSAMHEGVWCVVCGLVVM